MIYKRLAGSVNDGTLTPQQLPPIVLLALLFVALLRRVKRTHIESSRAEPRREGARRAAA